MNITAGDVCVCQHNVQLSIGTSQSGQHTSEFVCLKLIVCALFFSQTYTCVVGDEGSTKLNWTPINIP